MRRLIAFAMATAALTACGGDIDETPAEQLQGQIDRSERLAERLDVIIKDVNGREVTCLYGSYRLSCNWEAYNNGQ